MRLLTNAPVYVPKSRAPVPAQRDLPSTIRHAIRAVQDTDRLSGWRRAQHTAGNPALCRSLLRWSDVDLRLVRAAQRCPPFPHRPGGQRRCARRVLLNPCYGDRQNGWPSGRTISRVPHRLRGGDHGANLVDITRRTTSPGPSCLGAISTSCEAVYYSGEAGRCNTLRGGHETRIGGDALAFARDGEDRTT